MAACHARQQFQTRRRRLGLMLIHAIHRLVGSEVIDQEAELTLHARLMCELSKTPLQTCIDDGRILSDGLRRLL